MSAIPFVSVVIPFLDAADTLAAAVESARAQEGVRTEILCVDDGSEDDSVAVARAALADAEGEVLSTGGRGGAPVARNRGLERAGAPLVQFLDADDELLPGKLARQAALLAEGEASWVAGTYWYVPPDGRERTLRTPLADPWTALLASAFGRTSANLFSTEAVRAVGGWIPGVESSQDAELVFQLLKAGHVHVVDEEPGAVIHFTEGSISGRPGSGTRFLELRGRILEWLSGRDGLTVERRRTATAACFRALMDLPVAERGPTWDATVGPVLGGRGG